MLPPNPASVKGKLVVFERFGSHLGHGLCQEQMDSRMCSSETGGRSQLLTTHAGYNMALLSSDWSKAEPLPFLTSPPWQRLTASVSNGQINVI